MGVLSVGLSACGSDSSSDSSGASGSTSSVVEKEAGVLHVLLTVANQSGIGLNTRLCDESTCDTGTMQNGDSKQAASGGYFQPSGYIDYPDGSRVYFAAQNPAIGEPFIKVSTDLLGNNGPGNVFLSEGETTSVTAGGHAIGLERGGDTDYKVMRLTAG
jgi:hypothetical protein